MLEAKRYRPVLLILKQKYILLFLIYLNVTVDLKCKYDNYLDTNHLSKSCIILKVIQDGLIAVVQVSPVIFVCPQVIMISFVAEISFDKSVVHCLYPDPKPEIPPAPVSPVRRVLVPLPGSRTWRLVSEKR